jgi:hypothetical protein
MSVTDLLVIYDADDWLTRSTGRLRDADEHVGVTGGVKGLLKVLDQFVADKRVFARAVIQTHGNDGCIFFGKEAGNKRINADDLKSKFAGRKYETLFTYNARIYFNGCTVAAGDVGWRFLETAGSVFLGRLGGTTFGHTKLGRPMIPVVAGMFGGVAGAVFWWRSKGHVIHVNGDTRYVYTVPGGSASSRWSE